MLIKIDLKKLVIIGMILKMNKQTWWINMSTTAKSLAPDLGNKANALEWSRSSSPNAQYTEMAEGSVNVKT